ncbi:serine/threonine/tyrosine interacting like 1 [Phyllostomus discolor]|uniref:Serine/threonine/tyrosine interacting like 1 n=1 Tax=Phyllostomus discolor TaxID=89673 RepID=A0A834BGG6_9CHIR|nr:serine/threonine/tyrosine interacting like 1 [Phyllostomus discolor]
MDGLVLCEPTELYNILNQVTKLSRLTETNYLCLLDVRSKREYDESHVITAHRVKKKANEYLIPESVDLECVNYCVVYDHRTSSLGVLLKHDDEDNDEYSDNIGGGLVLGAAIECGRALARLTHHPIRILRGGYESFSATYHFFRTQKIIWMPQKSWDYVKKCKNNMCPNRALVAQLSKWEEIVLGGSVTDISDPLF